MHDYHKAADFLKPAFGNAAGTGKNRVTEINVLAGEDSGTSGENIPFCFACTPFRFGSPKFHTVGGPGQTGRGIKTEGILAA